MIHRLLLFTSIILFVLVTGCQPTPSQAAGSADREIRTVRLDYEDLTPLSRISEQEEGQYQAAGINRVGISAGRVDWAFFPWSGYSSAWANPVKESGINFLVRDIQRFGRWADVTVVVDVLAPVYIQAHPEAAAVSWGGITSTELVSLTRMTSGKFSEDLLNFIAASASVEHADSILLVELFYYVDGFGPVDLETYQADTRQADWPRLASGEIDINSPLVSTWRTQRLIPFLSRAAELAHAHNKQLWLEVKPDAGQLASQDWSAYRTYLGIVDRLVVMGNPIYTETDSEYIHLTLDNLNAMGKDKILFEIGQWNEDGHSHSSRSPLSPEGFTALIQVVYSRGITDFWFTPSHLLTPGYWAALEELND